MSARSDLVDAVRSRMTSAAAVAVAADVDAARAGFRDAPRVLVAPDLLPPLAATRRVRRGGVALLLPDDAEPPDAAACVRLGIEQVLDVEQAAGWLGGTGADVRTGRLVAVTGARGGCGSSTLAAATALAAAHAGAEVLLVDLDHAGGGLDVLLGAEDLPGPRWPDLDDAGDAAHGPVGLPTGLPALGRLRLLSAGRVPSDPPAEVVRRLLTRAMDAHALTVVDLPCRAEVAVLPPAARVLLVVPDEVRASTAAAARLAALPADTDVRLVVRDGPGGETPAELAARLGASLSGRFRTEPRLPALAERGLTRPRARSPLRRLADQLVADLIGEPA